MNPSYFRIRLLFDEAKPRVAALVGVGGQLELVATDCMSAIRLACTPEGDWRGPALFMYEKDGWSVFEDLTGRFGAQPASAWLRFAQADAFVFAGYNDAIGSAELVVITDGQVVREFSRDRDNPESNVDVGLLPSENASPFQGWVDVASFVDDDRSFGSDDGWLWVGEATARIIIS